MVYVVIPYIPDGPVTKALKKAVKKSKQPYKLGYLGELMDENYEAAIKHHHLLYKAEHLKKLKHVESNPEVVDMAFDILEKLLHEKNVQIPTVNEGRIPYYPNYKAIVGYSLLNAIALTVAIFLIVIVFQQSVTLMTVLIVLASILGTAAFFYTIAKCVTYVVL